MNTCANSYCFDSVFEFVEIGVIHRRGAENAEKEEPEEYLLKFISCISSANLCGLCASAVNAFARHFFDLPYLYEAFKPTCLVGRSIKPDVDGYQA